MENYSVVLFILAVMIGLSALAEKIKLPSSILLIVAGIALGFIPGIPPVALNPEIVLLIFLPPLLYDAAFNIRPREFRMNFATISTLAVSLVFLTTCGIAVAAHYMIPGMTWPLSFTLGAILAATDAVAALSITKGLGLSHKTNTILEGESLVNDASALVAYRFSVAAVTGTSFVLWRASLKFAGLMAGGLLVGAIMSKLLGWVIKRVHTNSLVTIGFMLLMPFVTYLVAENLHVSGVIAVVILALAIARFSNKIFPDRLKEQSRSFWEIIVFLLNGLIFILIGLQFPYVIRMIDRQQVLPYIGYAFVITVVALVVRMARVFLQRINLERAFLKQAGRRRRISEHALLDIKTCLILSWSGMRGIVSLAIAIALPLTLQDGSPFPQRNAIIFISVVVVLFTLLGQGLTLPWLVRRINKKVLALALPLVIGLGVMAGTPSPGHLIDTVVCRTDRTQSYAIYIPEKGEKEALPVIYFFDPHGAGVFPVKKYRSLADSYGFILVGSNNSRNGNDWPTTAIIWQHLFNDTKDRWKIDPNRIYTVGFSGGAKVAGFVAMNNSFVKGVIAGGAGLPDGTPVRDFPFSYTALAGEGDMNMTELVALTGELDRTRTRHRLLLFDGKHEWAPENTMDRAFAGLQFDAMRQQLLPKEEAFITRYVAAGKTRVENDLTAGRLLKVREECRFSIDVLEGLTDQAGWFKEKDAALDRNPQFQKQRKDQERLLAREQNTKTEYMQHFRPDEMQYWTETIHDLNARIRSGGAEKGMYQRLLAYLSLAFYSISNQLIASHHENARYFVELYKLVDAGNPEAWYFSAILDARERHTPAVESDLRRAVECGFRDKGRLEQQPEFRELLGRLRPLIK